MTKAQEGALIDKIRSLPPDRVTEVEDFIDFLASKNQRGTRLAARASEAAFRGVWDNADDAEYDRL